MKSGFISVVGRPSVGKSTLINALCGNKVSIVSSVPQTTRNRIRGIVSRCEGQLVLVDTPGYYLSEQKMNLYLNRVVQSSLQDTDSILYVIDASRSIGIEEENISKLALTAGLPLVVAINKIDLVPDQGKSFLDDFKSLFPNSIIFAVSAMEELGLISLLEALFQSVPEGEMLYPQEYITDQPPEFRISEVIREKAMNRLEEELPHALYVEVADLEQDKDKLWIRAFIVVERKSQVGIVVGYKGEAIHKIRSAAKREIKSIFPDYAVRLDLRVKVNSKWRKKDYLLNKMLY